MDSDTNLPVAEPVAPPTLAYRVRNPGRPDASLLEVAVVTAFYATLASGLLGVVVAAVVAMVTRSHRAAEIAGWATTATTFGGVLGITIVGHLARVRDYRAYLRRQASSDVASSDALEGPDP